MGRLLLSSRAAFCDYSARCCFLQEGKALQYAISTRGGEVVIETISITYCDSYHH